MQYLIDIPLGLGDSVVDKHSGDSGVVVQCLDDHYVRVLWGQSKRPTTHRQSSLSRVLAGARRWH